MIHLAGNDVVLGDRVIQRCLLCGTLLCDSLGAMSTDGSAYPTFPVGAWVEVYGSGMPTTFAVVGQTERPHIEADEIPTGCCTEANLAE